MHPDSVEARAYDLRMALEQKRFQTALVVLLERNQQSSMWDRSNVRSLELGYQVAVALGHLIPDHDIGGLRAIDTFCADVLDPSKLSASLALRGAAVALPIPRKNYEQWIRQFKGRLLALRAEISTRLGEDEAGLRYALEARNVCEHCQTVVLADAVAHGRAGKYDEAFRVLESADDYLPPAIATTLRERLSKAKAAHDLASRSSGPQQLQARASELAALELWGRAYDVLAPHKDEIQRAPGVAIGFAELAFRAGETAVAREVLSAYVSADESDATLAEWAQMMGWGE